VRSPHIAAIAQETGVREFHIGARKLVQTRMRYKPGGARVNKQVIVEEGEWFETDSAELTAAVAALRGR
jgi:copper homeostasis protein CutC